MKVISAWEIYWVMQLDGINAAFTALAVVSGVSMAVVGLFGLVEHSVYDEDASRKFFGIARRIGLWAFAPALAFMALLPSSRTAAAMIVLPKIANSPNIQREAGELYTIAKDALRRLATDDAPPEK